MYIKLNDWQSVDMREMLLLKKDNSDWNKQVKCAFILFSLNIYIWRCTYSWGLNGPAKKQQEKEKILTTARQQKQLFCTEDGGMTGAVVVQSLNTPTELTSVLHGPPGVPPAGSALKRGRASGLVGLCRLVFRLPTDQEKMSDSSFFLCVNSPPDYLSLRPSKLHTNAHGIMLETIKCKISSNRRLSWKAHSELLNWIFFVAQWHTSCS